MLKIGAQDITGLYVGETKIEKAYLGEELVFSAEKKPSRLPEGYTEVEYISLDNSVELYSAINMQTAVTRVVMDIVPRESLKSDRSIFYAASAPSNYIYTGRLYTNSTALNNLNCQFGWGISGSNSYSFYPNVGERITIDADSPGKTLKAGEHTYTLNPVGVNYNAGNMLIGGYPSNNYTTLKMDVYSVKIYRDGVLFGDFVPCVNSEGVVGMYNISTENIATRFVSASKGTIIPGPAV